MKQRIWAFTAVFALVLAACGGAGDATTTTADAGGDAAWPDKLIFGFVPSREASELQDNVDVLAGILSDALDIEVEGLVTTDYAALGVALGTGQAHIGAFAPANFVLSNREYPNIELLAQSVRNGSATYHAQYFTNDPAICGADPIEGAYDRVPTAPWRRVPPTPRPSRSVGTPTVPVRRGSPPG